MGTDYYKLLGVDRSASDDDIKKAYRKMVRAQLSSCGGARVLICAHQALKWHPDRNKGSDEATKKFKEVIVLLDILANFADLSDRRSRKPSKSSVTSRNGQFTTSLEKRA